MKRAVLPTVAGITPFTLSVVSDINYFHQFWKLNFLMNWKIYADVYSVAFLTNPVRFKGGMILRRVKGTVQPFKLCTFEFAI